MVSIYFCWGSLFLGFIYRIKAKISTYPFTLKLNNKYKLKTLKLFKNLFNNFNYFNNLKYQIQTFFLRSFFS